MIKRKDNDKIISEFREIFILFFVIKVPIICKVLQDRFFINSRCNYDGLTTLVKDT